MLNTLWKSLRRLTFGLMTLLVLLGLPGVTWQTAASKAEQKNFPPPGQLVEVGGYDQHIYCIGEAARRSSLITREAAPPWTEP